MTDKIMNLAERYAYTYHTAFGKSECDRAALAAAIKAEQDYTEVVISERDKLTMVLAERTVERDEYQRCADDMAAAHKVERDGLRRVAQMALDVFEEITSGDALDIAGELTEGGYALIDAAAEAINKELCHE